MLHHVPYIHVDDAWFYSILTALVNPLVLRGTYENLSVSSMMYRCSHFSLSMCMSVLMFIRLEVISVAFLVLFFSCKKLTL